MDAVARGETFTVTRDGREIGELVPLRRRRRVVTRAEFHCDAPGRAHGRPRAVPGGPGLRRRRGSGRPAEHQRGLLDTHIVILRRWIDAGRLPEEVAMSAVTLAELSAGAHLVRGDDAEARAERARRPDVLQRVENEFDPIPFDAEAARAYGRITPIERPPSQVPTEPLRARQRPQSGWPWPGPEPSQGHRRGAA